ncbi:hypothetical protein LCGC14_0161680 [marine sediment metagenome]|uniref:Uroporphyrinogen decarboxylase (URO-D) domain-containing protein n=1 Tax=marine sediment metagenome TaxID=412755 RepID=A0A0F9XWZ6_9ZZZZ|nr:hypothetical protein [Phycisphaerae bacterium]HDZ44706.1 hypothetical protein [Phycisphaerae bacterium]
MVSFTDAQAILKDPELVAIRDGYFARIQAVFDTGSDDCDRALVLYGAGESIDAPRGKDCAADIEEAVCNLADQADLLRDENVFRPLIINIGAHGVHFVDRLFGSHGYGATEERLRYVQTPVGELPMPDLATCQDWAAIRQATEAYLALALTVPVFTGPCLSSPLNQAMNLYGQRFLMAMLDNPAAARRDLRTITDVIIELHRWLIEHIPAQQLQGGAPSVRCQPPGYGQLGGCSTHLISAELYRDFIAPLDEDVLSLYPKGGMIHLCGNHIRHIRTWAQMSSLKCIQLSSIANEELEHQVEGLRPDQVIYVGPTKVLPLERIMDATGGYRVILAEDIQPPHRRQPKIGRDRTSA